MDESYAARYLFGQPLHDHTPFATISAVTPAHYLVFHRGGRRHKSHWSALVRSDTLRYRDDSDYEEHFLELFQQSVARRTEPGTKALAQLSGGMDSSTIVCVSDLLRMQDSAATHDLIDTISFYDDTEPSWNEEPFFTAVETQRGKVGLHLDVSSARPTFQPPIRSVGPLPLLPGMDSGFQEQEQRFERLIGAHGYRVIVSGIGGDELLGGVPTPLPELSDYLVAGRLSPLLRKGVAWSLSVRKPLVHVLWQTLSFTRAAYANGTPKRRNLLPWVSDSFEARDEYSHALNSSWLGATPSAITNARTWWTLLETLPKSQLVLNERREFRYPYLDRDLVDFLLRVPNEQLVRPGRRRFLMRRAVAGIVPEAVLERKRKGYIARGPALAIAQSAETIRDRVANSLLVKQGYIDRAVFEASLQSAMSGERPQWNAALMRTCLFAIWLESGVPISLPE
jgi:asparagine synthase (glutamine-hydrolysing)